MDLTVFLKDLLCVFVHTRVVVLAEAWSWSYREL